MADCFPGFLGYLIPLAPGHVPNRAVNQFHPRFQAATEGWRHGSPCSRFEPVRLFADVGHQRHEARPVDRVLDGALEGGQLPLRLRLNSLPWLVQSFLRVCTSL